MDSMRTLNKSLPQSPKPKTIQPPEQLLQAFKTAALSVTNLYKTAVLDQSRARQSGYQVALDDLLSFLDKENLGLGDGEGWRVRQWATERLDGTPPAHTSSDSDDDRGEVEKQAESHSPHHQRKASPETSSVQPPSRSSSPTRAETVPTPPPISLDSSSSSVTRPEIFTFRSSHPFPQDIDMQAETTPTSTSTHETSLPSQPSNTTQSVRFEVIPRGSRTPHRHNHPNRHNTRSTVSGKPLGSGAGSKRKIAFGDFFDLGNLGDGKDGSGGAVKRGRPN